MIANSSHSGRVVRVHLACRANVPIGSSLRVTGAQLWNPSGDPDGLNSRRVSRTMGRVAYDSGGNGLETNPMNERALMGIQDSHAPPYASSVEMVTSPDTYPVWRTKRPIILVLTDPECRTNDQIMETSDDGEATLTTDAYHHRYRYLVVTPGAEIDIGDSGMDDIESMLTSTKISSGSGLAQMDHVDGGAKNSNKFTAGPGPIWPVTLWEHPFISSSEDEDHNLERQLSLDPESTKSSLKSEKSFASYNSGDEAVGDPREFILANLPYRTLDIDLATASLRKPESRLANKNMNGDFPEYTEDGVLIDTWNEKADLSFRPYLHRQELLYVVEDTGLIPSSSGRETTVIHIKKKCRIFIVCYHLPVMVSKNPQTGEWRACWAESLLAQTGTASFDSSFVPHWVGTVTTSSPIVDEADKVALRSLLSTMDCTVLCFNEAIRDAHYKGFCKQVLWAAFHHVDLLDVQNPAFSFDLDAADTVNKNEGTLFDLRSGWDQRQVARWWEAFNVVNHTFASEVAAMVESDDVVWIHDYHLCLMPRMLGEEEAKLQQAPTKKIFFLHIPFPVSMIFKEMESGSAILQGMLHADVVGFHNFRDARHFLSSAKRILGVSHESMSEGLIGAKYKGRMVMLTMSSVSIEPDFVDAAMNTTSTLDHENKLREKHAGRMIICGVDVAQYLSGVGLKLAAYEQILRDFPGGKDKIVLIQRCLIPGARRLDEARTIRDIRTMVNRIKSKFGDKVIDYEESFGSTLPLDHRLSIWKVSDCLLNCDVRGGLNLWPLEFVYAQKNSKNPGIVIASEFSAVSAILNGALRISPFDVKLTVTTIDKALNMNEIERHGRNLRDIDFVSNSSSDQWMRNVLRDLREQASSEGKKDEQSNSSINSDIRNTAIYLENEQSARYSRLNPKSVISAYKATSRRVIILDFNGTIVIKEAVNSYLKRDVVGSIVDAPPLGVLKSLETLCADTANVVFVVSGDNKENVEQALGGNMRLGLAASNGSCYSPPSNYNNASRTWLALDLGVDWEAVQKVALPILTKFTARTNGSFIKFAHSSIGWSYYSCDPEFGTLQAKCLVIELGTALAAFDVRFVNLKGVVEVVPSRLNKGVIVKKILRDVAARDNNSGVDFILCMGDDVSDEKMFTSVFSFVSEMGDEYSNVVPSPPVIQLKEGYLPASMPFLNEAPCVKCDDRNEPIYTFAVKVGKTSSHASQYVDDAVDVADLLVKLAEGSDSVSFGREDEGEQYMQFS